MISILCPTRGRPDIFRHMVESARATCVNPFEVISYRDDDDPSVYDLSGLPEVHEIVGPRIMFSDYWNKCFAEAHGDILMHAGDDQIFRTYGWDAMVEDAYAGCPDHILMVHGSEEGQHFEKFGAILCLHRKWAETVGYLTPPYFVGDCPDDWLNEVANTLKRRLYLPFITEHMHYIFGKAQDDATYQERRAREEVNPPRIRYGELEAQRLADIEKLRAVMDPDFDLEKLKQELAMAKSAVSILCPTRRRPEELRRMVKSVRDTATNKVEIVCYVDDDDPEQAKVCQELKIRCVVGPRSPIMTEAWNKCIPAATGSIFMQGSDDMIMRTPGWDVIVEAAFTACPDHILMVHGHDVPGFGHGEGFGPFPFVHRAWTETIGYFIPPFFESDYGDAWVNELANRLNRRKCLPFEVEHMHFSDPYKKAPLDETYRERLERHDEKKLAQTWKDQEARRTSDTALLKAKIDAAPALDSVPVAVNPVPYVYPQAKPAPAHPMARSEQARLTCPECHSTAVGMAGGMRHCNQCSYRW